MSPKERLEAIERGVSQDTGIPLERLRAAYALEYGMFVIVLNLFTEKSYATLSHDSSSSDDEIISYFVRKIRSDYPSLL